MQKVLLCNAAKRLVLSQTGFQNNYHCYIEFGIWGTYDVLVELLLFILDFCLAVIAIF